MIKLAIAVVVTLQMAVVAVAANAVVDGVTWYYSTFSNGGEIRSRIISGSKKYAGNLIVPSSLGGYPVTDVGEAAFGECSKLISVSIPVGVTSIGERAFSGCYGLKSVAISHSVTNIGDRAFYACSSMLSIIIPSGVVVVGAFAFSGCDGLESVMIPDSVAIIGVGAFSNCQRLLDISVSAENNVFVSADGILYDAPMTKLNCCPSGKKGKVAIPPGVASIENWAFYGCGNLTEVSLPQGVTTIGERAFSGCSRLISMKIPQGVISISDSVFYGCESLQSMIIPSGVIKICGWAFAKCCGLTSLTIPSSVTSIEDWAFASCDELRFIYVENGCAETMRALIGASQSGLDLSSVEFEELVRQIPAVKDDEGAVVTGYAETGFVIKPRDGKTAVEVTSPQGVDVAKVTVEVSPKVASVKPNGAKVKVVNGGADITEFLNVPATDGDGVIDLTKATVKEEIIKEAMDVEKGAKIVLGTANPSLATPNTRVGLFYQLREGVSIEGMANGDSTIGDGKPWTPEIKVKGGNSAFYSIGVGKGE